MVQQVGNTDCMSSTVKHEVDELHTTCKEYLKKGKFDKKLNILLGYDPIDEINGAISKNYLKFEDLSINSHIDVVIRTATNDAPMRLSDFVPLQCSFAILYDTKDLFLDTKLDYYGKVLERASQVVLRKGK